jgi:hypothetical protein
MSFKRDGDDLDMLRRLKVVHLCFGLKKLAAEFGKLMEKKPHAIFIFL